MFLLDTDHVGIIQRATGPEHVALKARVDEHSPKVFFVSIVTFHEQVVGWHSYLNKATSPAKVVHGYEMFQRLLVSFAAYNVVPFDEAAAVAFQEIQHLRIGRMDLRIAATALSKNLTVLTRNTRDFDRVPGLRVEDWTTA